MIVWPLSHAQERDLKINLFYLTIFLSFLFSSLVRAEDFYQAKENLPSDFALAIQFYQKKSDESAEQVALKIKTLDAYLTKLTEEERLMFLKSELYKAHLKLSRGVTPRAESYEPSSLPMVLKTLNEKKLDPYTRFFLQAISQDLKQITQDSGYPTFLVQWRTGPQNLSPQFQGLKRRLDILLPWVEWLNFNEVEGLELRLFEAVDLAVESVTARMRNYFLMGQVNVPQTLPDKSKLQFFSVVGIEEEKEKPGAGVIEIIDQVIDEEQGQQQTTSEDGAVSGWVPRTEPDENYRPPEELPTPVKDWDPKPLDDWLDDL